MVPAKRMMRILDLWCGPTHVNLKRKAESMGAYHI